MMVIRTSPKRQMPLGEGVGRVVWWRDWGGMCVERKRRWLKINNINKLM
jgi:hypothetical protein